MLVRRRTVLGCGLLSAACGVADRVTEFASSAAGGEGGEMPIRMGAGMGFGSTPAAPSGSAPSLVSIAINSAGTTATLTFDEALDAASVPATSAFSRSGTSSTVSAVNVTGSTVELTLSPGAYSGEVVAFGYTPPGSGKLRDALANNVDSFSSVIATNGSTVLATPLGVANYTLYFDPALHGFNNGDVLSADITPSIGASVLTPGITPTYSDLGVGGRGAIDFGTTSNSYLVGNGYAPLMDGHDKVISGAVRFRRVGNESGTLIGWGRGSTTDQYFEIGYNTSGRVTVAKDGTGESPKTYSSTGVQLQFTEHTIGWTIRAGGTLLDVYLDGVIISDLTGVDIDTADPAIQTFRIGTTGRSTGGTDDSAAVIGQVALGLTGVSWTAQNHLDTHDFWVALQPPAPVGTAIAAIGDSLTKAAAQHGWRGYKQDRFVARSQSFDWQGSASDGDWADNQHSGVNGTTLDQISARATAQYGIGKSYQPKLVYACMIGTNSLSDSNGYVDTATAIADWTDCITAIDTAITTANAAARIVVTTLPNFETSASTYARQQAFNAALPAAITAWNAAHPTRKLFFADIATALGAWNAAYQIDEVHPNNAGNQIIGASIDGAVDADGNTLVAYEASIAA
jgi:lysophospholipase L1-like esterase